MKQKANGGGDSHMLPVFCTPSKTLQEGAFAHPKVSDQVLSAIEEGRPREPVGTQLLVQQPRDLTPWVYRWESAR